MSETTIQLYRHYTDPDLGGAAWWTDLQVDDVITGRWRLIDGDLEIEVSHLVDIGFWRVKMARETNWYGSDQVRFVETFNCASGG